MTEQNNPEFSLKTLQKQLWNDIRQQRDKLLAQADIEINIRLDDGEDVSAWRAYRKALRALPQSTDNPTEVVWPKKPGAFNPDEFTLIPTE